MLSSATGAEDWFSADRFFHTMDAIAVRPRKVRRAAINKEADEVDEMSMVMSTVREASC